MRPALVRIVQAHSLIAMVKKARSWTCPRRHAARPWPGVFRRARERNFRYNCPAPVSHQRDNPMISKNALSAIGLATALLISPLPAAAKDKVKVAFIGPITSGVAA